MSGMRTLALAALALVLAGCTATPSPTPAEEASAALEPAAPTEFPLAWEGATPVGAYACVQPPPTGPCPGYAVTPSEWLKVLPYEGTPTAARANLAWEPVDDAVGPLVLNLWRWVIEDGQAVRQTLVAGVEGASPLALDVASIEIEEDEVLGLTVWPAPRTASPQVYGDPYEQPFVVDAIVRASGS